MKILKILSVVAIITMVTSMIGVKAINGLSFTLSIPGFNGSAVTSSVKKQQELTMQSIPGATLSRGLDVQMQRKKGSSFSASSGWHVINPGTYDSYGNKTTFEEADTRLAGQTYRLYIDSRITYPDATTLNATWFVY